MSRTSTAAQVEDSTDAGPFVVTATPTVLKLARMCAETGQCSLRRAPYTQCFCLELFRHAIVRNDNEAWAAVYTRYAPMVCRWLGARAGEGDAEVAAVFERFWHAVDAAKFANFETLPALLQYLKMCAHAVRVDRVRAARAAGSEEPLDEATHAIPVHDDLAETVAGRVDAAGFWRTIRDFLANERECMVLYLSYTMGLTPRQIRARHSTQFPDVGEIYRLKRNGLDRLRRAPNMQVLLGQL